MPFYVQRQPHHKEELRLETVDEAETRKEAVAMTIEWRKGDPSAIYYVSNRACKGWVNK